MCIAAAAYACIAGALVTVHWIRWHFGYDTGIYTKIVLGSLGGGESGGLLFATHFSPLLVAFYPLLALTHSSLSLLYAQVIAIGLAPVALYAFIRPHVDAAVAQRVGIAAVLYPPTAAAGIGDFHILAVLPLIVFALAWSADRGRWVLFSALAVLALTIREDVLLEFALIGTAVGLVLWRSRAGLGTLFAQPAQRRRLAIASACLAGASFVLAVVFFAVIQPAFGRAGWFPALYYRFGLPHPEGGMLAAPAVPAPSNPSASLLISLLQRAGYVLEATAPLVFLPFRTPWWLLALPGFAIVLSATSSSIWTMGAHYALLWSPWLVLAAALGVVRIHDRAGASSARRWSSAAIAACAVFLIAFNPMHLSYYLRPPYHALAQAREAIACMPAGATVAMPEEWFAHSAATHPGATADLIAQADYLIYADDDPDATFQRQIKPAIQNLLAKGNIRPLPACSFGPVHAYARAR